MSEMIERAFEAGRVAANLAACQHEQFRTFLRAAIGAMREPTDEMLSAGWSADPLKCDVPEDMEKVIYTEMWQAMIDAALNSLSDPTA